MKNIDDFLNEVKKNTGSDYKTAAVLGLERMAVSSWRTRRAMPSNKHVIILCDEYGLNLEEAIRAIEYSRENERPLKQAGFVSLELLGAVGVSSAGLMSLSGVTSLPEAAIGAGFLGVTALAIHYAK